MPHRQSSFKFVWCASLPELKSVDQDKNSAGYMSMQTTIILNAAYFQYCEEYLHRSVCFWDT